MPDACAAAPGIFCLRVRVWNSSISTCVLTTASAAPDSRSTSAPARRCLVGAVASA